MLLPQHTHTHTHTRTHVCTLVTLLTRSVNTEVSTSTEHNSGATWSDLYCWSSAASLCRPAVHTLWAAVVQGPWQCPDLHRKSSFLLCCPAFVLLLWCNSQRLCVCDGFYSLFANVRKAQSCNCSYVCVCVWGEVHEICSGEWYCAA